jgi:hypothetical protein
MKTTTITLNPGAWLQSLALALRNTFADVGRMLLNPRLWIGLGSSLLVHAAIILLSIEYGNKAVPEDPETMWNIHIPAGGTEHPRVIQILEQSGAPGATNEVSTHPIKLTGAEHLQALTESTIDPTDVSGIEPHGFIIITDKQLSVAEILGREPVKDIRLTGGHSLPGIIPIGPAIDPTQTVVINPEITNPVVEPIPVGPDGEVSPTLIVKRSTGFPQWDNEVKTALKKWKFKSSETLHRNGRITFKFVLN